MTEQPPQMKRNLSSLWRTNNLEKISSSTSIIMILPSLNILHVSQNREMQWKSTLYIFWTFL